MNENEVTLVRQMQQKDAEAFDEIFERYHNWLFRMAYLISGNYADSEDIVQGTFIKCYYSCKELKDCSRFSSWLYQILTRTAWRYAKKQKREEPVETFFEQADSESGNTPLESILRKEQRTAVMAAVNGLELKQRTVVILYYYNQLSSSNSHVCDDVNGSFRRRQGGRLGIKI